MGLFDKPKSYDCRFGGKVAAVEGITAIPGGSFLAVMLNGDVVTLSNSDMSFVLNMNQIANVGTYGQRETVNKDKNVIGRSLAGAALFGGTGAIVGGLSGVGSKKSSVQHFFSYICFTSSKGDLCRIDFELDPFAFGEAQKFNKMVKPANSEPIQL